MKPIDICPGVVFKYAKAPEDGLKTQEMFIRMFCAGGEGHNAVNVANWTPCDVDWGEDVIIVGTLQLLFDGCSATHRDLPPWKRN